MSDQRHLFGTDGIRGRANRHPMTPELVMRLGRAIAEVARRHGGHRHPRVLVGKDTRLSGYLLENALAAGICARGGRVLYSGPLPTPGVANLTQSMRCHAGVVISASHNPFADNGIKIFGPDGFKLPDADEAAIERMMEGQALEGGDFSGERVGRAERLDDAPGRYVVHVKNTFPRELTLDGLRVVVDAAHGAAYRVAPEVFAELGADVHALGVRPNGRNINKNCGALHPEHVVNEVKKRRAHLGVALDGDADRVILVDEQGTVVDGDEVMALVALRLLKERRLARRTLACTVMSNLGLELAVRRAGGRVLRTAVGDRYVVEAMRKKGLSFGGEQSGHLVFLEHATTGDGLLAALQVLAILVREARPLSELRRVMDRVPQRLVSETFSERRALEDLPTVQQALNHATRMLGEDGRLLVRWSGTEPKLRVMAEGPDERRLDRVVADVLAAARKDLAGGRTR